MKKLIYTTIALFFLFFNSTKGQFTLENVYDTTSAAKFFYNQFQHCGEKYIKIVYPDGAWQTTPAVYEMRIYELNHSLWKVIDLSNLPRPYGTGTSGGNAIYDFLYISDSLFDGDSLIEFLYCIQRMDTGATSSIYLQKWDTYIFNENQTQLFYDSTAGPFYAHANIPQIQVPIVKTSAGTKMILATLTGQVKVFGLAGGLPTQYESVVKKNEYETDIYPNPSSSVATIKYNLPKEVYNASLIIYDLYGRKIKSFIIDKTFDSILLSTDDLQSGTYFYIIQTSDGKIIQGKKFVTIKS